MYEVPSRDLSSKVRYILLSLLLAEFNFNFYAGGV